MKSGRNDPCPCGSGKKYKRCHLAAEESAHASAIDQRHDVDRQLVDDILHFLARYHDDRAAEHADDLASYPSMMPQLASPWLVYVATFGGERAVDLFLKRRAKELSSREREWLELQRSTPVSIWEVLEVEPGVGLTMRDALTGNVRKVREVSASRTIDPHAFLLGRVVDASPHPLICGMHGRTLDPVSGGRVVEAMRETLGGLPVTPERLLDDELAWEMLDAWSDEIDAMDAPRKLANTDGEPFVFTTDRWRFDARHRAEIVTAIAALDGSRDDGEGRFIFIRASDDTIVASVVIEESTLQIETNSVKRADVMRARIEGACGSRLEAMLRSHADPLSDASGPEPEEPASTIPDEERHRIILEVKTKHYERWLDEPVPVLGGKTPRAVAQGSEKEREAVRLVLNDIELTEKRFPEEERIDVNALRRELGMG